MSTLASIRSRGRGGVAKDGTVDGIPVARKDIGRRPIIAYTFLTLMALLWLVPVLWTFYASLRSYQDTAVNGYFSIARSLTLDNYFNAYSQSDFSKYLLNSAIITIPAVIMTLFLASMVAFVVSRYSFKLNVTLLLIFTAGNLLPPQIILVPLYRLYLVLPLPEFLNTKGIWYDSYWGVVMIHIAFQMGFATFVLSNFMKALPKDISEAATIDGASVWQQYWRVILPLCRTPLAALAVLLTTWIYNDFLWALVLMSTGDKRPITAALNNLKGQFFTDYNLLAAGSMLAAIPTMLIFFILQRQFVAGLTLGATKG
ncbi:MAG: carbohydrate ABC transporter permease [Candidatus Nanopelagicales bacterium]